MSQFDHSQLLQLVHYKGFPLIFESWPRLVSIFGNSRTLDIAKIILENDNAEEVLQLSDQLIRLNFNGYAQGAIVSTQKSNMNPEKSPNKKQESDEKTILRDGLFQYLKSYREFTSLGKREVQEVIQITFQYQENIRLLSRQEILSKVKELRGKKYSSKQILINYLQVADSALYYSSKDHRLRSTQIISLILFLFKNKTERVLLQILTGEGKSTVVSCLAAILAISGKKVDIVTTSQLLAKRDVQEKERFYDLMGLHVCHNFQQNQKGPKQCYQGNNIIYGTPHSFQVDILFDEYKKKQTRCKRSFDAIIVDEVDSMFVDQKGHQTLLATTYPGFSEFIYPMKVIWNKIKSYPIYQEGDKTMMVIPLGNDQTITGEAREVMNEVIKDIREQFKNEIITEWRMDFINQSLDNWIKSAITAAFIYKQKEHYFIKNKDIAPIDLKNTGVIQQKVHWDNGLHQFLQIKHGLNVSAEGMTSNFISNLAHFDRYDYLYGLTGTLGSDQSKKFLVETFNVELMKVPPFKQRKLQIDEGMVLYNKTDWARYIVDQIRNMIACERSVLLICESIHEVQLIKIALQGQVNPKSIQFLTTGEEKMRDHIDCKELIVATNLAGRGTDLKISQKLNERGGLHVIIGFMPSNLRVEMQGRGRAGRNGCEGSSELAVNYSRYCQEIGMQAHSKEIFTYSPLSNPQQLTSLRDQIQAQEMKKDRDTVQKLRLKDKMFAIYCKGMDSIPDFQKNYAKQLALEQQWAMFLKKVQNRKGDMRQALKEAQLLVKKMVNNSQSYFNPNHEIARGNKELFDNKDGKSYQRAIPHFEASTRNTNSTARIIGGTMLNSCKLNQNPQNGDNIRECLKGFAQNKQEIKNKIEMLKGMNGYDNFNKCFVVQIQNQQINRKEQFRNQLNIENGRPAALMNTNIQQINLNSDSNSEIQIESGQQRILNALYGHIQKIQQTIKGLGKNEFVRIKLEPIQGILDSLDGDKRQNEKALEKFLADGLRFQLVAQKYKKKVPWWKRALVFALGVVQIVCGAIILGATAGALTGFGVAMMVEGATQCFDAIFRPQLLENLGKYYGKVALSYMFSLAMSGTAGIKELGTLGKKGFTLFKNMPFKQFMSTTFSNAWKGMKMLPGVLLTAKGAKGLISPGVRNLMNGKNSPSSEQIGNPIRKIQSNKQSYKKKIDAMLKDQDMQDADVSMIKQRFDNNLTKIIQSILSELDKNLLAEARNVQINNEHAYLIISDHIKQALTLSSSSPSQSQSIKQLFKKHLKDQKLAERFSDHIKLKSLIKNALSNIGSSKNYSELVRLRTQQMIHKGLQKQESLRREYLLNRQSQLTNEKNYLESNKGNITPNQYIKKVEAFNSSNKIVGNEVEKFNKFIESQFNKPQQWLYNMLKEKKAFTKAGRVDMNIVNTLQLHEYTKNGLAKIDYIDSMSSFEKALENAVYNEVVAYGQLIINAMHSCRSQISKKVREVANQFNK